MNKIQKFIDDNRLGFSSEGSGLNSNCTVISGYALHIGLELFDDLYNEMPIMTNDGYEELQRVFEYAKDNNYEKYWTTPDAKGRWIF
jgi:hypothetical protein